jgi:hypothetical protein
LLRLSAHATEILYEPFNFTAGQQLNAQAGWSGAPGITISSGSLSVSGLAPSSGNKSDYSGSGGAVFASFPSQNSGTVYVSFILQTTATASDGDISIMLSLANGSGGLGANVYVANPAGGSDNNSMAILTQGSGGAVASPTFVGGETVFVVGRYTFVAGANNDRSDLWVNPNSSTFGAGAAPAPDATSTGGPDPVSELSRVYLWNNSGLPLVDEL